MNKVFSTLDFIYFLLRTENHQVISSRDVETEISGGVWFSDANWI